MVLIDSDLLRRLRMGRGWTQEDLAAKVGCDSRTVQRAEQGQGIRLRTAKEISQALGVDLPTIMPLDSRDDDQTAPTSRTAGTGNRERKYVYIGNTADIPPFEEIAGKVEDASNWEATGLGLHVEVYLSPEEAARVHALETVSVFDEKQHVLTAQDIALHDQLLWSKRATEANKYRK
ncbi:MAG: helix-turn-helix transcriptional regulator [Deltaproteobacteria bacterium]|nr:helix-turn-helix transcriptional regulator [Deltaproteobacteria bacterium]